MKRLELNPRLTFALQLFVINYVNIDRCAHEAKVHRASNKRIHSFMPRANCLFPSFYVNKKGLSIFYIYQAKVFYLFRSPLSGFPDIQNTAELTFPLSSPLDGDCDKKNVTPEDGFRYA